MNCHKVPRPLYDVSSAKWTRVADANTGMAVTETGCGLSM
jgi:hypothetical protein